MEKARPGCLGRLMRLFVFLVLASVAYAVYLAGQAQDLRDLNSTVSDGASVRDVRTILEKSHEGKYSVEFTDQEINGWLEDQLILKQSGVLGEWVSLKGVKVRFSDGFAELIMERQAFGYAFTSSMFVQVERVETPKGSSRIVNLHGGPIFENFPWFTRGGRIGGLTIPQGFLHLYLEDFKGIAEALAVEIELGLEEMPEIKFSEGKLQLDPRYKETGDLSF